MSSTQKWWSEESSLWCRSHALLNRGSIRWLSWGWWWWRFLKNASWDLEILTSALHSQQIRCFDWSLQVFLSSKNYLLKFACLKCVSLLLSCHLNQQACQKCTPSYQQRQTRAAIANIDRSMSYYPCDRTNKLPKGRSRWRSWGGSSNTVVNASHRIVGELYATVLTACVPER